MSDPFSFQRDNKGQNSCDKGEEHMKISDYRDCFAKNATNNLPRRALHYKWTRGLEVTCSMSWREHLTQAYQT